MNRQLKFRAWDGDKLFRVTMLYLTQNGLKVGGGGHLQLAAEAVDLMQFTGLKDKNDVEIYEGDIVRASARPEFSEEDKISDVIVDKYDTAWAVRSGPEYEHGLNLRWWQSLEVIGNIYEHPELLK